MGALVLIYDYFEDRAAAAARIRASRPLGLGLLGVLLGGAGIFVSRALLGRLFPPVLSVPFFLLSLGLRLALILALTAVAHLILDLSGARGDAGALFIHLGLSELAWLAAVPAVLLGRALAPGLGLARLGFWAAALWSLALKVRALRDEYAVGGGRAIATLVLPPLILAALLALAAGLALAALALGAAS